MKISKRQLKRIIREEKNKLIAETRLRRNIRRALREAGEIPPEGEEDETNFDPWVERGAGSPKAIDDFPAQMTFSVDIPGLPDGRAGLLGIDVNDITRAWKLATTKTGGRAKLRNNRHAAEAVSKLVWEVEYSLAINAANEEGIEPPQHAIERFYSAKAKEYIKQMKAQFPHPSLLPHIESFAGYKAGELNSIINHPEYEDIVQDLQNNVWSGNFRKNPKSKRSTEMK